MKEFEFSEVLLAPHGDGPDDLHASQLVGERLRSIVEATDGSTLLVAERGYTRSDAAEIAQDYISRGVRPILADYFKPTDDRRMLRRIQSDMNLASQSELLAKLDDFFKGEDFEFKPSFLDLVYDEVYQSTRDANGEPRMQILYEAGGDIEPDPVEELVMSAEELERFIEFADKGDFISAANENLPALQRMSRNMYIRDIALAERIANHPLTETAASLVVSIGEAHRMLVERLKQQGISCSNIAVRREADLDGFYFEPQEVLIRKMARFGVDSITDNDLRYLVVGRLLEGQISHLLSATGPSQQRLNQLTGVGLRELGDLADVEKRAKQKGALACLQELF